MPTLEPNVISGPIQEPVTVGEAQLYNKADYSDDDALYAIWIAAARDYVESQAGITMHEKTLEVTLDTWPSDGYLTLPRATPLIAITSVTSYDPAGVPAVMSASGYIADVDSKPGRIQLADGQSWPSGSLLPGNGIRIRYRAGIATASPAADTPANMKYPVLLLVNGMDRNRSSETVPDRVALAMISLRYGVDTWIERLRVESVNY